MISIILVVGPDMHIFLLLEVFDPSPFSPVTYILLKVYCIMEMGFLLEEIEVGTNGTEPYFIYYIYIYIFPRTVPQPHYFIYDCFYFFSES